MHDRLLVRHFLNRFLDNDLVSPDADRHDTLAVVASILISLSLFLTVLLVWKYLEPFPSPGRTALKALPDRFFYISCSMLVMALAALAVWDALALDGRDGAILGPLPIRHSAIVAAKLKAVGIFAAGFVAAINLVPGVIHPMMTVAQLHISWSAVFGLVAAQATVLILAGAFGFLCILGVREATRLALGETRFQRAAGLLQAVLVVACAVALLLLPGAGSSLTFSALAAPGATLWMLPPFWFLGLQETVAGGLIERLPVGDLPGRIGGLERTAAMTYRSVRPVLGELAGRALLALGVAALVAPSLSWWNNRRLPLPIPARPGRRSSAMRFVVRHLIVRHSVARAGFCLALRTIWRSRPHRLSLALAAAAGIAVSIIVLAGAADALTSPVAAIPLAFWSVQTVMIAALLIGFRQAAGVPADPNANWIVHLSWPGDRRHYLDGVKRAALTALVVPVLAVLAPLHVVVLGGRLAAMHLLCGFLVAALMLDILMWGLGRIPLASSRVAPGWIRTVAPLYFLAVWAGIGALAYLERAAFATATGSVSLFAALATVLAAIRLAARRQPDPEPSPDFDGIASPVTQRIGLSA